MRLKKSGFLQSLSGRICIVYSEYTVADVDAEDNVGNSLLQIWELTFGPKTKLFSDFEHKGWSRF